MRFGRFGVYQGLFISVVMYQGDGIFLVRTMAGTEIRAWHEHLSPANFFKGESQ